MPNVYIDKKHIGGANETIAAAKYGKLKKILEKAGVEFEYKHKV